MTAMDHRPCDLFSRGIRREARTSKSAVRSCWELGWTSTDIFRTAYLEPSFADIIKR